MLSGKFGDQMCDLLGRPYYGRKSVLLDAARLIGVAMLALLLQAKPSMAAGCLDQAVDFTADWRFDDWISEMLVTELSVTSQRSSCPTTGYIKLGNELFAVSDTIYVWFRLQGNPSFFDHLRQNNITEPVIGVDIYGYNLESRVLIFSTDEDAVTISNPLIDVGAARAEAASRNSPLRTRQWFDWRFFFNFSSTRLYEGAEMNGVGGPRRFELEISVSELPVHCLPSDVATCVCPPPRDHCFVQLQFDLPIRISRGPDG